MAALKPAGAGETGGRPVACVGTPPLSDVPPRGVCSWVGAYGWSAGCSLRGRGRQPSLTSGEPWQPPLPLPRGLCPSPLSLCWARRESEGGLRGGQTRGGAWGRHRGGRGRKGERKGSYSESLLRLFFPPPVLSPPHSPPPRPVREGCGGAPGAPVSLELESSRASLTCKLASSDWLWQQRAATPPSPVSVCVCVWCVCVCARSRARACAARLEGGAALIALDSTDSSTHVYTHTHTHTHTYTEIRTHSPSMYIPINTIHAYTPAHSQRLLIYTLGTPMDTQSHTVVSRSGRPLNHLRQACQAPPSSKHTISHCHTQSLTETNPQAHQPPHSHTHTHTAPVDYTKSHPDTESYARQALRLHNLECSCQHPGSSMLSPGPPSWLSSLYS